MYKATAFQESLCYDSILRNLSNNTLKIHNFDHVFSKSADTENCFDQIVDNTKESVVEIIESRPGLQALVFYDGIYSKSKNNLLIGTDSFNLLMLYTKSSISKVQSIQDIISGVLYCGLDINLLNKKTDKKTFFEAIEPKKCTHEYSDSNNFKETALQLLEQFKNFDNSKNYISIGNITNARVLSDQDSYDPEFIKDVIEKYNEAQIQSLEKYVLQTSHNKGFLRSIFCCISKPKVKLIKKTSIARPDAPNVNIGEIHQNQAFIGINPASPVFDNVKFLQQSSDLKQKISSSEQTETLKTYEDAIDNVEKKHVAFQDFTEKIFFEQEAEKEITDIDHSSRDKEHKITHISRDSIDGNQQSKELQTLELPVNTKQLKDKKLKKQAPVRKDFGKKRSKYTLQSYKK